MKSDFRAAIAQIAAERGLSKETIMEVLESALKAAYRRSNTAAANQNVRVDLSTGEVKVFVMRRVVEEVEDAEPDVEGVEEHLEQGVEGDEIVEAIRLQLAQQALHASGFKLEDAIRIPGGKQFEGLLVVEAPDGEHV